MMWTPTSFKMWQKCEGKLGAKAHSMLQIVGARTLRAQRASGPHTLVEQMGQPLLPIKYCRHRTGPSAG